MKTIKFVNHLPITTNRDWYVAVLKDDFFGLGSRFFCYLKSPKGYFHGWLCVSNEKWNPSSKQTYLGKFSDKKGLDSILSLKWNNIISPEERKKILQNLSF